MVTKTRRRHSPEFKAKVALDAIRGELTMAELSARHGVHATVIAGWKKQAIEGMSASFSGRSEAIEAVSASGGDEAARQERSSDRGADIGVADGGRPARGQLRFLRAAGRGHERG